MAADLESMASTVATNSAPAPRPSRRYAFSAATIARRAGSEDQERLRIVLAVRSAGGNVMKALRESLSDYSERTLKRTIKSLGLQSAIEAERERAKIEVRRKRAEAFSCKAFNPRE